eukprot:6174044-Pleurochrysis_carterae.AAC.2
MGFGNGIDRASALRQRRPKFRRCSPHAAHTTLYLTAICEAQQCKREMLRVPDAPCSHGSGGSRHFIGDNAHGLCCRT